MSFPTEQTVFRITDKSGAQVLVKIKAVSLNFRDTIIAKGMYPYPSKRNAIAAADASGEVVKVGSNVTDLEIGDRVINNWDPKNIYGPQQDPNSSYSVGYDGVLAQYKEAAVLVCTGVTAWNALYGSGTPFIAGQTVLLLGTGGVSVMALVLAKAAGAVTIITSSSDEKLKYVKEKYGADHTINYKEYPDWDKKVLELTGGKGADFVVEVGGNATIAKSISALAQGGQIPIIGFIGHVKEIPDLIAPILFKSAHLRGFSVGSKQLAEDLIRFVHAKKIPMPVEKVFGYTEEEIHNAYAEIEGQSQVGKIIVKVD